MRYDENLFSKPTPTLFSADTQVVFVSDAYPEHLLGGAELTLQALIDTAPCKVEKILSSKLTIDHLKQGAQKFWIFGNYAAMDPRLMQAIVAGVRYSIVECDYKFCRYRSVEKHELTESKPCDCHQSKIGEVISGFMANAEHVWWMSEIQREVHHSKFPFLVDYSNAVLSSVFNDEFFSKLTDLRNLEKSSKWMVLDSKSWVKGTQLSETTANDAGLEYELVGGLPYDQLLEKLAGSHGLVFCPAGGDTCPRLVIEAKLLGCKLLLNDNVQHAKEEWFDTDDLEVVEDYLRGAPATFWKTTAKHVSKDYTLSGYATTFNCVKQEYPFEACIESMLGFCDEVVVVDAGSTDGTLAKLGTLQVKHGDGHVTSFSSHAAALDDMNKHSKLKVYVVNRDWSDPRSALFDGMQKAEARARCTSDYVWQMDVDEVVRADDFVKIRELVANFPKAIPMLSLPVVEYWGGFDKVRLDVTPWKWRMSRNSPRITHGVPAPLRAQNAEGHLIAMPGTDGCDPVDVNTGDAIVFLGFLTGEMDQARQMALAGDAKALIAYEGWFTRVVENVPSVYHASWLDIERKIRLYRDFWTRHWTVLEGKEYVDTAESNMFFNKKWKDVSDADISEMAERLKTETGGHIFHRKWKGEKTLWMTLSSITPPKFG